MLNQAPTPDQVVLHVEDSDDFAALVDVLLDESGFAVHRTRTLAEGEAAVASSSYSCAFVDLDLPDAGGLEAVMTLRSASPALPLVIVSGQASDSAPIKAMLLGAQDWVGKHEVSAERLRNAAVLAIARQDTLAKAVWEASHDEVTGLPNRSLALEHLTRALGRASRRHACVAVLFCDLDRFKAVNDDHGHAAGDAILSQVAHRLIATVRPGDVVGRWGGDEFVIIAEGLESGDHARAMGIRIRDELAAPMVLGHGPHATSVSVGIAATRGSASAHDLVDAADAAMLAAKRSGTGLELAGF